MIIISSSSIDGRRNVKVGAEVRKLVTRESNGAHVQVNESVSLELVADHRDGVRVAARHFMEAAQREEQVLEAVASEVCMSHGVKQFKLNNSK